MKPSRHPDDSAADTASRGRPHPPDGRARLPLGGSWPSASPRLPRARAPGTTRAHRRGHRPSPKDVAAIGEAQERHRGHGRGTRARSGASANAAMVRRLLPSPHRRGTEPGAAGAVAPGAEPGPGATRPSAACPNWPTISGGAGTPRDANYFAGWIRPCGDDSIRIRCKCCSRSSRKSY